MDFKIIRCAFWCAIYVDRDRLQWFRFRAGPLTWVARKLDGEFRIPEEVAGVQRSHAQAGYTFGRSSDVRDYVSRRNVNM